MGKQSERLIAIPLWVQIVASAILALFNFVHLCYPHLL